MTNQFITGNTREPRRGTKEKRKTIWGKSCRLMMPGLSGRWTSMNTRRTKPGTTRPTSSSPLPYQHSDRKDPVAPREAPQHSQDLGARIRGNGWCVCWLIFTFLYFQTKIPWEKSGEVLVSSSFARFAHWCSETDFLSKTDLSAGWPGLQSRYQAHLFSPVEGE